MIFERMEVPIYPSAPKKVGFPFEMAEAASFFVILAHCDRGAASVMHQRTELDDSYKRPAAQGLIYCNTSMIPYG